MTFHFSSVSAENTMTLFAQTSIKEGEEITIQYLSFMYGLLRRKREITSSWFFECKCPR